MVGGRRDPMTPSASRARRISANSRSSSIACGVPICPATLRDRPVVALQRAETFAHALLGQVLEGARDLFGPALLVGAEQHLHLIDVDLGFARHQVAGEPCPDRIEAGTRNAAAMLARRRIIDEVGLEQSEEQPLRISDTGKPAAFLAGVAAQRLEDGGCAGRPLAAEHRALKLRGQQRARFRLQFAQILTQPSIERRVGHAPPRPVYPTVDLATAR